MHYKLRYNRERGWISHDRLFSVFVGIKDGIILGKLSFLEIYEDGIQYKLGATAIRK